MNLTKRFSGEYISEGYKTSCREEMRNIMTFNYVSVNWNASVKQAMNELVRQAAYNDNINALYVIDDEQVLIGVISLKDLIIAREDTELDSIIEREYPYVFEDEHTDDCIERIKGLSGDAVPVVDICHRLKGVLTSCEIEKLIDDDLSDDYAKLGGLAAEEDLYEKLSKSIGKRLPWLVALLGLGLVVSSVVGAFESVVAHLALIVSFQSLILDMAGNAGTQSLAVTIRVLMDDKIEGKQKLYLVFKEARIGLTNGFVLGILSFIFTGIYLVVFKGQTAVFAFSVSFCTGAALVVSVMLAGITGTVVPVIFKKLNIDPAVASGPLITTINDLVAVVAYYGIAWVLLIDIMGL